MTDARVARVAEKALVVPTPVTRVARVAERVLARPSPNATVARVAMKVLIVLPTATSGTGSLSLSATGAATSSSPTSGSGSLSLSASGSALLSTAGSADISLSASGVPSQPASGSGSLALSAAGDTSSAIPGSGSVSLSATGVTGVTPAAGTGSLSLSATGSSAVSTTASAIITLSGSGVINVASSATASFTLTGSGSVSGTAAGTASITLSSTGTLGSIAAATGSGALALSASGGAAGASATSGSASLTLTTTGGYTSVVIYGGGDAGGSSSLGSETITTSVTDFRVTILDDTVRRAPSSITVVVAGGRPEQPITFKMDSGADGLGGATDVYTTTLDSEGSLGPTSLTVIDVLGGQQGTRTLVAAQLADDGTTTVSTTDTYFVRLIPTQYPTDQTADAGAVDVPGAVVAGIRHWVFQDLLGVMDGGIGSYIMPINPSSMTSPHYEYAFSSKHTTAHSGKFHVFQAGNIPKQWQLNGVCVDEAMQDKLMEYRNLNRRFYVIDHRNRAWKVVFTEAQFVPRLRVNYNGEDTDWFSDYTLNLVILDQDWSTPS